MTRYLVTVKPPIKGHDSRDFRIGKGSGFVALESHRIALMRCPECECENYTTSAFSGCCSWCDFTLVSYKEEILEKME